MKNKYGEIVNRDTIYLYESVRQATVKDNEGVEFRIALGVCMGDRTPIIKVPDTGKQFKLSWLDIINLAEEAGLFLPENVGAKGVEQLCK